MLKRRPKRSAQQGGGRRRSPQPKGEAQEGGPAKGELRARGGQARTRTEWPEQGGTNVDVDDRSWGMLRLVAGLELEI